MTRKTTKNQTTSSKPTKPSKQTELPTTLMGHLNELKNRLFWVALFFIVSAVAVFPFFDQINALLVAPLKGEELHFFTPAGGLSFIFKICLYLGVIGALPAFVYHMYKFVQPVMTVRRRRALVGYTLSSIILALAGIAFTYTIVLPAAVNFLTTIEIAGVDPVLSVDSYIAFVIAYIVAGALLFQLPLIMLLINSVTPLPPQKLLSYERHVVIGAFIAGAILSPTPDVVNQALLALPLIVMYQIGFLLVGMRNKFGRKRASKNNVLDQPIKAPKPDEELYEKPEAQTAPVATPQVGTASLPQASTASQHPIQPIQRRRPTMDAVVSSPRQRTKVPVPQARSISSQQLSHQNRLTRLNRPGSFPRQTIDGVLRYS